MDESSVEAVERSPVAIIGAGAVGTVLARRLRACGYDVAAVISRSVQSAQALAASSGAPVASDALEALPVRATLVFLCVPDRAVQSVAEALSAQASHPWSRSLVAHTSGALPAATLRPLADAGAQTLSFHPLQAFVESTSPDAFEGIYVGVEGTAKAVDTGCILARALGAQPLLLSAETKGRYHLAASVASNFLVTLTAMAEEILGGALDASPNIDGVPPAEALLPLVAGTLHNLRGAGPQAALTGPIARGDEETVTTHLDELRKANPGLTPAYATLATQTVRLAREANRLAPEQADRLLERLSKALHQTET